MSEQKAEKGRVPTDGKETGQGTKPDAQPSEQPVIGQKTNPDGAQPTEKTKTGQKGDVRSMQSTQLTKASDETAVITTAETAAEQKIVSRETILNKAEQPSDHSGRQRGGKSRGEENQTGGLPGNRKNENDGHSSTSNLRLKRAAAIVSAAIFLAVTAAITYFCIDFFKKFSDPAEFKNYINSFGIFGRAAFLALQIIQIVIAFIPGEVVQVGAGYAYGAFEGTVLCLVGAAIASAIVFLLVKKVGTRIVYLFVSREKMESLKFLNDEQKLGRLIFILFLIPGAPKDVLTYLVGLTRIRLYEFLIISLTARTPALLLSTLGGSAVADRNYKQAVIIFSAAAIVSAAGIKFYSVLTKKLKARHEGKKDKTGKPHM